MLDLADVHAQHGCEVESFSMQRDRNTDSQLSAWSPSLVSLDSPAGGIRTKVKTVGRMIWSREAQRGMADALASFKPDIIHLHSFYHQLPPSILPPIDRLR